MNGRFATEVPSSTERVLSDVGEERERQFHKWGPQHHPDGTNAVTYSELRETWRHVCDEQSGDPATNTWLNIQREETYEAFAEEDLAALRKELVQVAAVAVAWIEDLDSRPQYADVYDLGGEG